MAKPNEKPAKWIEVAGARDELGIPRFSVAAIRSLQSGDIETISLPGSPLWYPLGLNLCPRCQTGVLVSILPRANGALMDLFVANGGTLKNVGVAELHKMKVFRLAAHACRSHESEGGGE